MTDWKRIAYEWENARGSMGSFHRHLCEAIIKADIENMERLRKGFPELVAYLKGERTS